MNNIEKFRFNKKKKNLELLKMCLYYFYWKMLSKPLLAEPSSGFVFKLWTS